MRVFETWFLYYQNAQASKPLELSTCFVPFEYMPVLIDQALPAAVARLDANDARRVWQFLDKFLANPAHASLSLERVTRTNNENLWSARITQGLRAILHKDGDVWTVLYAGQHDAAYHWAERRQIARHPRTGALQVVESPEVMESSGLPHVAPDKPRLFDRHEDDYLESLGVPHNWLPTLRRVQSSDDLWQLVDKLPEEVVDRLLQLAEGKLVTPPVAIAPDQPVTASQDTRRRFFILENNNDLLQMLEAPLATWLAFLHPSQQKLATGNFNGPVKISGSAGTGKTVVAMHRARHLARQGKRVLLTSYVSTLCKNIEQNLALLCSSEERSRITVATLHSQALAIAKQANPNLYPVTGDEIGKLIEQFYHPEVCPLAPDLLKSEWDQVIQDQGITCWDDYRQANRAGRGFALTMEGRRQVWQVFEQILATLDEKGGMDWPSICRQARVLVTSGEVISPFDAVIVDELQDLRPQEIRLLAALAGDGDNALTLLGDGGQRIYNTPFSLRSLGIDVRGRSHVLRINYRTTEQIRQFADAMLDHRSDDMDGGQENRKGTVSLLHGPEPVMQGFATQKEQQAFLVQQIQTMIGEGLTPEDIAIFARTNQAITELEEALNQAGLKCHNLKQTKRTNGINLGTMHRAKGLEFKAVFVINVSDDQIPPSELVTHTDDAQFLQDTLLREKQLLYVSLTRARDELFITWVGERSRFLAECIHN